VAAHELRVQQDLRLAQLVVVASCASMYAVIGALESTTIWRPPAASR
jgi:hypothetical protein